MQVEGRLPHIGYKALLYEMKTLTVGKYHSIAASG
jgi:hypothetical protein